MNNNKDTKLENNELLTSIKALNESDYATVKELNIEASTRAGNDQSICDRYDNKFGDIDNKFIDEKKEIDNLKGKVETAETDIKNNDGRITVLEEGIWDQIRRLEDENKELNSKLEEALILINEKDKQIEKLKEDLGYSSDRDDIDIRFSTPPEYTITELLSVKDFINKKLKDLVVPKMNILYPEATFGEDYTIVIAGLTYNDVMQGKILTVVVKAVEEGKLIGESKFDVKVTYNYNATQKQRFIEELLQPAIPVSLRNIDESKSPNYNVPAEIAKTRPLKLLLNNRDYKHFVFKILTEMNSASYWTDFHRPWQFIRDSYGGTGYSNIGGVSKDKIINNIVNLFYNNSGYHNSIFRFIERLINDSGVPCTVNKKCGMSTNGNLFHTIGNLIFDVPNINLDNNEIVVTQDRAYYMMINFEITTEDEEKKFYRGVTLALTDNLELYPTLPV